MRRVIAYRLIAELLFGLLGVLEIPRAVPGQVQRPLSLPPNTAIPVRLNRQLDTAKAHAEEVFSARLSSPVVIDDRTVFARGSKATGRVREVTSSSRLQQPASITLELTDLGGAAIRTNALRIGGKRHLLREARLVGSGTKMSTDLSATAWGERGERIGFGIGGGSRTATHYVTDDSEIVLPAETVLAFGSL